MIAFIKRFLKSAPSPSIRGWDERCVPKTGDIFSKLTLVGKFSENIQAYNKYLSHSSFLCRLECVLMLVGPQRGDQLGPTVANPYYRSALADNDNVVNVSQGRSKSTKVVFDMTLVG